MCLATRLANNCDYFYIIHTARTVMTPGLARQPSAGRGPREAPRRVTPPSFCILIGTSVAHAACREPFVFHRMADEQLCTASKREISTGPGVDLLSRVPEGLFKIYCYPFTTSAVLLTTPLFSATDIYFCVALFLGPKDVASWQRSGTAFHVAPHLRVCIL